MKFEAVLIIITLLATATAETIFQRPKLRPTPPTERPPLPSRPLPNIPHPSSTDPSTPSEARLLASTSIVSTTPPINAFVYFHLK